MNYLELQKLLEILKEIPNSEKRDEAVRLMLQTASDSITYDSLQSLLAKDNSDVVKQEQDNNGILLKFTNKEISKIPMRFKKKFLINDRLVRCRRRESGRKTVNYEIRYRRHGFNISVSSNDLEKAKSKFIEALIAADKGEQKPTVPTKFCDLRNTISIITESARLPS